MSGHIINWCKMTDSTEEICSDADNKLCTVECIIGASLSYSLLLVTLIWTCAATCTKGHHCKSGDHANSFGCICSCAKKFLSEIFAVKMNEICLCCSKPTWVSTKKQQQQKKPHFHYRLKGEGSNSGEGMRPVQSHSHAIRRETCVSAIFPRNCPSHSLAVLLV